MLTNVGNLNHDDEIKRARCEIQEAAIKCKDCKDNYLAIRRVYDNLDTITEITPTIRQRLFEASYALAHYANKYFDALGDWNRLQVKFNRSGQIKLCGAQRFSYIGFPPIIMPN